MNIYFLALLALVAAQPVVESQGLLRRQSPKRGRESSSPERAGPSAKRARTGSASPGGQAGPSSPRPPSPTKYSAEWYTQRKKAIGDKKDMGNHGPMPAGVAQSVATADAARAKARTSRGEARASDNQRKAMLAAGKAPHGRTVFNKAMDASWKYGKAQFDSEAHSKSSLEAMRKAQESGQHGTAAKQEQRAEKSAVRAKVMQSKGEVMVSQAGFDQNPKEPGAKEARERDLRQKRVDLAEHSRAQQAFSGSSSSEHE